MELIYKYAALYEIGQGHSKTAEVTEELLRYREDD